MTRPKDFLNAIDDAQVVAAIRQAEGRTSAEIRVFIAHGKVTDALTAARRQFGRLKMHQTSGRDGVLIYVAPRSHTFALHADIAAHRALEQAKWDVLAATLSARFKAGDFTGGLTATIAAIGEQLAATLPRRSDDRNELSDAVEHG